MTLSATSQRRFVSKALYVTPMAPRPNSTGFPASSVINSYWSNRCCPTASVSSSSPRAARRRQLTQQLSVPSVELSREPHCAQTGCRAVDSTLCVSFMTPGPKHCKDSAIPRQSPAAMTPYEQLRGERSRDNAIAADEHAFSLSLWAGPFLMMLHHMKEELRRR